ncbi:MAG: hypothetical protein KDB53_19380 [Planctomycetes bacterium]|nr:hypothetical protein [Planctomycetota bacterium]
MRGLASGEEDFKEFKKLFSENFVFLNVYCKSVAEEHEPRGPEGPFRFVDRSVPVLVIKSFTGDTVVQNLGFIPDPESAKTRLSQIVKKALKDHGKVTPPKVLRPLLKAMDKARAHCDRGKFAAAWCDYDKVVTLGQDPRKFPDGPPTLAVQAAERAGEILGKAKAAVQEAVQAGEADPSRAKAALRAALRDWGAIPEIKEDLVARLRDID